MIILFSLELVLVNVPHAIVFVTLSSPVCFGSAHYHRFHFYTLKTSFHPTPLPGRPNSISPPFPEEQTYFRLATSSKILVFGKARITPNTLPPSRDNLCQILCNSEIRTPNTAATIEEITRHDLPSLLDLIELAADGGGHGVASAILGEALDGDVGCGAGDIREYEAAVGLRVRVYKIR